MRKITVEEFTAAMERAVALKGEDYIYKAEEREYPNMPVTCWYREDGEPSCIIGHVLEDLGIPYDENWENSSARGVLGILEVKGRAEFDFSLAGAARRAQEAQDSGETWGEALAAYKKVIGF